MEKELPAVALAGALTAKWVPAPTLTAIVPLLPVMVPVLPLVLLSVAVRVWFPGVFKVAVKTLRPPLKVLLAGSTAAVSLLAKLTVPA